MKIIISTSTFPAAPDDHSPSFVLDQVIELSSADETLEIHVLIPHNSYVPELPDQIQHPSHVEVRYHYMRPHRLEKLTGRGILPALRENPARYLMIPLFLFAQRRALTRLCRVVQPDLIYAHWYMPQGVIAQGVSRHLNIPFMFTTHASDVSILGRLPFSKRIITAGLRQANLFTAVSRRTAKKLTNFFSEEEWQLEFANKLTIVPMGTQSIQSKLDSEEAQRHLIAAGVVDTRKSILALGRLSEKKGFEFLIDAYSKLDPQVRSEYQLVIAGDGQLMTQLRDQVIASGQEEDITFTGYVSGTLKASLFQLADIFVLPSIVDSDGDSEGLPVTLMEALSYGKLIVATDVSGAEEVLHRNCGILVNQKSAAELAAAIETLTKFSEEDRNAQVSEARLLAVRFDWKQIALEYLALIKIAMVSKGQ